MADPYRIFGMEDSPYSVKVRSYLRYKQIPHEWVVRNAATMEEYRRHARLPLIPVVVTPEGEALQDSTPLIEALEERHPEPALQPADPACAFLSALVEDRHGNRSTILTSQLPVADWHDHVGDPTVADAICDRLLHNAHRIVLQGPSRRRTKGQ